MSFLNVKALVGAFNQEKVLVRAFSMVVKTGCGTDGSIYSTSYDVMMQLPVPWSDQRWITDSDGPNKHALITQASCCLNDTLVGWLGSA